MPPKNWYFSPNFLWFRGYIDATSLHRCNLLHWCNFECCVSFCLIQTCKVEEIESGRDKTLNPNPQLMNNRIATCHSGIISPTIKWYNMALSREYHRVSEMNRIMRDHLDFLCDVEIEEELTEPAALPKRIIRDRMNPLELRPLEFRVTFGMSKEFFKDLLDLLKPQLTREQQGQSPTNS